MTSPETLTTFSRDGLTFDVSDEGPRDGEIIVLLHGFPQLNTSWAAVAEQLHAAGYRTIAPNQRGYSDGARPRGRRAYRMSELVADIAALIDELADGAGGSVHLAGHDWGAAVAWAVAMEHPDKLRTLTAVSVPHPSAFLKAMPRGQIKDSWYMALFNVPYLPEKVLSDPRRARALLGRAGGMPPETIDVYLQDFAAHPERLRGGLAYYRALPFLDPRALSKVTVPTTYVWSDGDTALGRPGAELCGDYVSADYTFEVVEGASHWLLDEEPERIAAAIRQRVER